MNELKLQLKNRKVAEPGDKNTFTTFDMPVPDGDVPQRVIVFPLWNLKSIHGIAIYERGEPIVISKFVVQINEDRKSDNEPTATVACEVENFPSGANIDVILYDSVNN